MYNFYNFYLSRYRRQEFAKYSQAKLTLQFCIVTAFFSLLYILIANLIDFRPSAIIMPILALLFFGLTFLIRAKVSLQLVSYIYLILSFSGAVILTMYSGMIYSSIIPWMAFLPLAANLLIDRRSSVLWLVICISALIVIAFNTNLSSNVPVAYNKEHEVWFYAGVYAGLYGIILSLSMVFQRAKENALKALQEKNKLISSINKELKYKNSEILAQNNDLIQQKEEIVAQREFIEIKNKELLLVQEELNNLIDKLTTTQNSLANREAENRSILEAIYNTQLLVAELDLNGRLIKISPEAVSFFQMRERDLLGTTFMELSERLNLKFEDSPDFQEIWQGLIEGGHFSYNITISIREQMYWIKENFFPILNDEGKTTKIMVIAQDISQIKNQQGEIEALNIDLKDNIAKIERQNELLLKQQGEIEKINKELKKSNNEIMDINLHLEKRVKERTRNLEIQNQQLSEYAYINSHLLRGPMCSILGLVQLMENYSKGNNRDPLLYHMKKSSHQLKKVIDKISKAIEKGTHFDRKLIHDN